MSYSDNSNSQSIFRAIVKDTSKFVEKGTIGVYIEGVDFEETDFNDEGRECIILTPFGGLDKMGLIMCPPIGAQGYVMFPGGILSNAPVWMGGAVIPAEKNLMVEDDKQHKLPKEVTDPTDILLKTQYTKKDNQVLNKSDNKVENYIKLTEDVLTLAKVRQDDYEKYDYSRTEIIEQPVNSIQLKSDSITFTLKQPGNDSSKQNTLTINDSGITITFSKSKTSSISIGDNGIQLNAGDKSTISLGTDGVIAVDGEKEIDLNGSSDNLCKWSGFNDFVDTYNGHTHGTPDGPSSDCNNKWNQAKSAKSDKVKCT